MFTALRTAGALIPVPGSDAAAATGAPTAPAGSPTPRVHAFTAAGWIERPSARVSLRDMDDVKYRVINDASGEVLAEVEEARAMWEIHEGAIFQHQGAVYKVLSFNLHTKEAHVRATKEAYFTTTIDVTDINVLTRTPAPPQQSLPLSAGGDIANTACVLPAATSFGRVLTTMQVFGYRKVWRRTYQTFEECRLALPPLERQTCGVWADIPLSLRTALMREGHDLYAACHAAAHAVKAVFPLFVHCDVSDVATECQNELATRARPFRVMLIDRTSGGLGITTAAARCIVPLFRAALHMLEGCACTTGCAACVLDVRCSQGNSLIDKDGARRLISGLLSPLPPT
ncbi:DUF1998 domain-containing protein [archaeon]|nr:MAG: DUF1998 domain-containing protein [archaeon]